MTVRKRVLVYSIMVLMNNCVIFHQLQMLDTETKNKELNDEALDDDEEVDLVSQLANMSIATHRQEATADQEEEKPKPGTVLTADNPVFQETRKSAKVCEVVWKSS